MAAVLDISEVTAWGEDMAKAGKAWPFVARDTAEELTELMVFVAKRESPVGVTSNLRNSMTGRTTQEGHGRRLRFTGEVFSDVIHAEPVDLGRGAGNAPPFEALIRWVEVVMGIVRKRSRSVAFLVARKIGRKGFKGKHFFRAAAQVAEKNLMRVGERHLARWARKLG